MADFVIRSENPKSKTNKVAFNDVKHIWFHAFP